MPDPTTDAAALMAFVIGLQDSQGSPRRQLTWRVGDALRAVIEQLVSTTASDEELTKVAEQLETIGAVLSEYPHGRSYEGVSEASTRTQPSRRSATPNESTDHSDFSPIMGQANPLAPPLRLGYLHGVVTGEVTCGSAYEGPPGHVHGGIIAALFDELLGATQVLSGTPGMTGKLEIYYRAPVPLHSPLRFAGRLVRVEGRKIFTEGTLHSGETLCAEATGLFISINFEKLARMVAERDG